MRKILNIIPLLFLVYVVGFCAYVSFLVLRAFGKIKIVNLENWPRLEPGMLILSNHPDLLNCMLELLLVPALIFTQFFWHPSKLGFAPYFTPDKANFTNNWWFWWMRSRAISIQRGEDSSGFREAKKIVTVLKDGILMYQPECGRTCTGSKWIKSAMGREIRVFKKSLGNIVRHAECPIAMIWLENGGDKPHQQKKRLFSWPTWRDLRKNPIIIKFGIPISAGHFQGKDSEYITESITRKFVKTADQ